jgi:hypothetical protein
MASSLLAELVDESFPFLLPALEAFFSPLGRACEGLAGTACPSATPFEPSAGLEGFDEDNRRWWQR